MPLREIVTIHDNKRIPLNEIERKRKEGNYPYCGANGILDYIDDYIFEGEHILLAEDGGDYSRHGKSAYIMKGKFWVNNHAHVLAAIESKTNNLFLLYALNYYDLNAYVVGSTRKKLNQEQMKEIKISLPPLQGQKIIAEILSTVDQAIEKVDEAIEKTQRLKKGLMQELLTKGIGHNEFQETKVGRVPKEWQIAELSKIGDIVTGTTPSTSIKKFWGEGLPFITPSDFSGNKYVIKTGRTVTKEGAEIGRINPRNSVLVVCIASVGEVAMSSEESITNQQINSIVCNIRSNSHYVYYAMSFNKKRLKRWAGITTSPIIKKSFFGIFPLPLPPLPEQQKIAEILGTVDKRLGGLRNRKEKLEKLKKGLMDDLLTGRKRVKLEA